VPRIAPGLSKGALEMNYILAAYLGAAIVFLGLDFAWLAISNKRLYRPILGAILLDKPRLTPAVVFYLIYLAGLTLFAIEPSLRNGSWKMAACLGAALGLVAYSTYDLTNQATLSVWTIQITLLDLAWGTFVSAAGATAGYAAARWAESSL